MNTVFPLVVLTVTMSLIGGSVQANKSPYLVRICKDSASLRCSGILISPNLVLTSGFCVYNTKEVRVYVGTTEDLCSTENINDKRTILSKKFFKAPNFNLSSKDSFVFSNDLAIILLPNAVSESSTVKVAPLSENSLDKLAGGTALLSGWGQGVNIQYATTTIQNQNQCTAFFLRDFDPTQQGCGKLDRKQIMYFLDPGSPLDYKGKIVGYKINDRSTLQAHFLFVNIHKYLSFIRDVQKKHAVPASGYHIKNSWILLFIVQVLSMYVVIFIVM